MQGETPTVKEQPRPQGLPNYQLPRPWWENQFNYYFEETKSLLVFV